MSAVGDGNPALELEKYAANLQAYYAIAMDVGAADSAVDWNRQLHTAMTTRRIPHAYEEYDGDRTNRLRERIERNVLVFFARHLASPANLTSPSPSADRLLEISHERDGRRAVAVHVFRHDIRRLVLHRSGRSHRWLVVVSHSRARGGAVICAAWSRKRGSARIPGSGSSCGDASVLAAGVAVLRSLRWAVPLAWFAAGAVVYAFVYCVAWSMLRGGAWINVVMMAPAALFSTVSALDISAGTVSIFRRAVPASAPRHVGATLVQIVLFWSFFLFVVPTAIVFVEREVGWPVDRISRAA